MKGIQNVKYNSLLSLLSLNRMLWRMGTVQIPWIKMSKMLGQKGKIIKRTKVERKVILHHRNRSSLNTFKCLFILIVKLRFYCPFKSRVAPRCKMKERKPKATVTEFLLCITFYRKIKSLVFIKIHNITQFPVLQMVQF